LLSVSRQGAAIPSPWRMDELLAFVNSGFPVPITVPEPLGLGVPGMFLFQLYAKER